MSFWVKASNPPNSSVTAPTSASTLMLDPPIDMPSQNTGYRRATM